ncbi:MULTISPECIES: flagellar hook capping FlgD N-terminal domain-containing protein [unclassified Exiguobacterium]|uniref:flagellar hook capping FlgD N-terminal domain-containing protein n=1 Tax=unclassified Exiguobacterium TaxID=2644629 RepID=UPI0008C2DD26|nr:MULTISPECIES: flagellar hook capping FlgD N-terminal domain-containing protein [unclassified Exiguobacterium]OGX77889.1 flagellar hook capping protein [Exiguobacterium sp. SH31]TCI37348.1 flagellar hook capping protein [Exiguobacterium sp. SH4S7]TCI45478.1 flagellar hook capping protein [Exiguobacterium sp. SH5S32]TCI52679.1 flagellar hook capping protein [Exiguobacterium sp. SH1S4]TCI55829.1 flagellar hook capping protein [Exiguobacterium sp. SH1S21]
MTTIQPKTNDYTLPDQSLPKATNQYDKDMFLKLLMAQLGNQDPMSPMEDREFISQMAQFSSLEQMQTISKQLDSVLVDRHMASISEFSNMIGKTVDHKTETETETIKGSGRVVSISRTDESGYMADLEDGSSVSVYNITSIKQA